MNKLCIFTPTGCVDENNKIQYVCQNCGHTRYSHYTPDKIIRSCKLNEKPTLLDKAKNLTVAVVKHAVNGFIECSDEQYNLRLKICETCPFNENWVCQKKSCGCNLRLKAKWASEECPEGKWPKEETKEK